MPQAIPLSLKIPSNPVGLAVGPRAVKTSGPAIAVRCPMDGSALATVRRAGAEEIAAALDGGEQAFKAWRLVAAGKRGEFVRRIGNRLRERKADVATLVTLETGKITQEA